MDKSSQNGYLPVISNPADAPLREGTFIFICCVTRLSGYYVDDKSIMIHLVNLSTSSASLRHITHIERVSALVHDVSASCG
ncbi:Hypothetical protein NTJ_02926 [Nesidiocoris tenuis]|uniref:Uncharacterized protein n=1 Tax=Nesidiocoris tenuis TaxID=355587 RepID=A0ABN7AG20_9HEMI|nr:Hypothetical protein NTJ_02926 [Nesidiocoris tenuis]